MCLLQMGAVLNRAAQKLEKKRKKNLKSLKAKNIIFILSFPHKVHINQRDNSVTELWHLIRWTPTENGKMEWLLLKK